MARKHEHFGLSYLEELNIVKERENICKESRREFLKFKQETTATYISPIKSSLKAAPPDQSHQITPTSDLNSSSSKQLPPNTDLSARSSTSKSLKKVQICPDVIDTKNEAQDFIPQQKESIKVGDSVEKQSDSSGESSLDYRRETQEDEGDTRMPVGITSLVGTSKKITMSKKPRPLQKPDYKKFIRARLQFNKRSVPLQKESDAEQEPSEQKKYSQHAFPTTITGARDDSSSEGSTSSEKSSRVAKDKRITSISKHNLLASSLESERTYSKKSSSSSALSSVKSVSEKSGILKSSDRHFPLSKSQIPSSIQKFPVGMVPRSIDEIIASLQSTSPTPSDLRIKELLESVLGEDYSIKMEVGEPKQEKYFYFSTDFLYENALFISSLYRCLKKS